MSRLVVGISAAAVVLLSACGDSDDQDEGDQVAVESAYDYTNLAINDTLATALYEIRGSREFFEAEARREQPGVWAEISADGEVTFEEFRSLSDVRDALNHYGGDFIVDFENEMGSLAEAGDE